MLRAVSEDSEQLTTQGPFQGNVRPLRTMYDEKKDTMDELMIEERSQKTPTP